MKTPKGYAKWRRDQGIRDRCDDPVCRFYTDELEWAGKPLPLRLDFINGDKSDRSFENLRYLCPICKQQADVKHKFPASPEGER